MAKQSRAKRPRGRRQRPERELVALFRKWGLEARRVPIGGGGEPGGAGEPGDDAGADAYKIGRDERFVGECKVEKDGFHELYAWLESDGADYLALRAEHAEWIFVLPERVMRELLTQ